jgi:hypothetical membrane protein
VSTAEPSRAPRWWASVSASAAPVALIGGWTLAASRQPTGYSALHETISALAAHGATDRWIMTTGLAVLGSCHVVTALGLRPARLGGRSLLAVGGLATIAVAAFPQPEHGSSSAHVCAAAVGFLSLTAWPFLAARNDRRNRGVLSRRVSWTAGAGLIGLLVWFGTELNGELVGLSERTLAGAQALWPLAVVLATARSVVRLPDSKRRPLIIDG